MRLYTKDTRKATKQSVNICKHLPLRQQKMNGLLLNVSLMFLSCHYMFQPWPIPVVVDSTRYVITMPYYGQDGHGSWKHVVLVTQTVSHPSLENITISGRIIVITCTDSITDIYCSLCYLFWSYVVQ